MHPALEKYMNFNKRGFEQLAAAKQSVAVTECCKERGREEERKTKGKQGEKTLGVIATPLPNC